MRSFQFNNRDSEEQQIEEIISNRKHKIAKQQIIFTLILIFILIMLSLYIFRKMVYTEFDGYIESDYTEYRALDDLFIVEYKKDIGEIVVPGDTLYSYIYIKNLMDITNLASEPDVLTRERNIRLQAQLAAQDLSVQKVKIQELEKQIALEEHDIRFGLTDHSHEMDLKRQLEEEKEELQVLKNKLKVYTNIQGEVNQAKNRISDPEKSRTGNELYEYFLKNEGYALRYEICQDTSIITKRASMENAGVFKKEPILQIQPINIHKNHMTVMAYVPIEEIDKIQVGTEAEAIVNESTRFKVRVKLIGTQITELPESLRNNLSRIYKVMLVAFEPYEHSKLPLWVLVDQVPIKIRIYNLASESNPGE